MTSIKMIITHSDTMFAYNFSSAKGSLYGYNPHSKGSAYDQNVSQNISAVMEDA